MTGPLYRLGRLCVRRRREVLAAWLVLVVAIVVVARSVGQDTNDNIRLPGSGTTNATDLLDRRLPKEANGSNPIVLEAPTGKLTEAKNRPVVEATTRSLRKARYVERAVSPLAKAGVDALSKDARIGYVSVTLTLGPSELTEEEANSVIDAARPARDAGFEVAAGGYLGQEVSKPSVNDSVVIGLAAAVIILVFAFGTVVAMGLPITTAVLGLAAGMSCVALLSHAIDVPTTAPTLGTMIGLGVGIDYALFIVTRHRTHLARGLPVEESVARATATAGGAVVFAGSTVVVALCSLALAGIPIVAALGYTAAIVVAVAVTAAITLLPALLGVLGGRINRLRLPVGRGRSPGDHRAHGWARWARWISHRPWLALVASVLVLAALAWPALHLHLGQPDLGQLPTSEQSRRSYDLLTEGFGPGSNGPLEIAVELHPPAHPDRQKLDRVKRQQQELRQEEQADEQIGQQPSGKTEKQEAELRQQHKELSSPASDPRLVKLEDRIKRTPGVKSVTPAKLDKKGNAAVFTAVPTTAPSARATQDLVDRLRSSVIPKAIRGTDLTVNVGGSTAGYIDLADRIDGELPRVIAIVVGISMILLLLAFRSLVVPVKAALMNLLSIGAAYGVLVAVFQKGWGEQLVGLDHAAPIVSYVPLLMFAILFGLSMDYEVFLLTQIQEHYRETRDNLRSVVEGLAATGRVITSAALIMVSVFTAFILNGDPTVKQFGLGMAVAIAVDATIVRCMLVPAIMVLMRRANWWLPAWLSRLLPRIGIEGDDYFERRDAAAASAAPKG